MPSTFSKLNQIKKDYSQYKFVECDKFAWSPPEKTIFYDKDSKDLLIFLLHELSHAVLGHNRYDSDVQLLSMECEAWGEASQIAAKYSIRFSEKVAQSNLDSYREWMFKRSSCPKCHLTGVQTDETCYKCAACGHKWQVNEARTCNLRRFSL